MNKVISWVYFFIAIPVLGFAQLNEDVLIKRLTPPNAILASDLKHLPKELGQVNILKLEYPLTNDVKYLKATEKMQALMVVSLLNNNLDTIPGDFFKNRSVLYFSSSKNPLKVLNSSISNLDQLQFLILKESKLDSLPSSIAYCQKLIGVEIEDNKPDSIFQLPFSFGYLKNLQLLRIHNTNCDTLPRSLGELANLKILYLANCGLKRVPKSLGKLYNLNELDLSDNKIESLPETIYQLKNLQTLVIKNNPIQKLGPYISNLQKLQILDIRGTQISKAEVEEIQVLIPGCRILY